MARQATSPVIVDVSIDRETFRKFSELYTQLGLNFRDVITQELQEALLRSLEHKEKVFMSFGKTPGETPPTVPTVTQAAKK